MRFAALLLLGCASTPVPEPVVVESTEEVPQPEVSESIRVESLVSTNAHAGFQLDVIEFRRAGFDGLIRGLALERLGDLDENLEALLSHLDGLHFELIDGECPRAGCLRVGAAAAGANWNDANMERVVQGLLRAPRRSDGAIHHGRRRSLLQLDPRTIVFGDTEDLEALAVSPTPVEWSRPTAASGWFRRTPLTESLFVGLVGGATAERGTFELSFSEEGHELRIEIEGEDRAALLGEANRALQLWHQRGRQAFLLFFGIMRGVIDGTEVEPSDRGVQWRIPLDERQLRMLWNLLLHVY